MFMKQAAGEANMTVITIVLIGVVAGVGLLLIPRLMENVQKRTLCTDLGGTLSGNKCTYDGDKVCVFQKCIGNGPDGAPTKHNGEWVCVGSGRPMATVCNE